MRPQLPLLLLCGLTAACAAEAPPDPPEPAADEPLPSWDARYELVSMTVVAEPDTDGDGVVDNHLAEALAALEELALQEDFTLDVFNERIVETIQGLTDITLHAVADEGDLDLAVFTDAGSVTDEAHLLGLLDADAGFTVGPGDLVLPVLIEATSPVTVLQLADVVATGELTADRAAGRMSLVLPIESVLNDLVAVIVPDTGWDVDGDGVFETKDEVMTLAEALVPLLADVETRAGEPGLSGIVDFEAVTAAER